LALIDLHFADDKIKVTYDCNNCIKNTKNFITRKCEQDGFNNHAERPIDKLSYRYTFCVGKATWYEEIIDLFDLCIVAYETGIMPNYGGFLDQEETFREIFPMFVQRWKRRNYNSVWLDVSDFSRMILESIFGKKR